MTARRRSAPGRTGVQGTFFQAAHHIGDRAPELRAFGIAFLDMGSHNRIHLVGGTIAHRVDHLAGQEYEFEIR